MQKTKEYDKFIFCDDNREKGVEENHVKLLVKSISTNNLLRFRPILVTPKMEIIDGQHRLKAAQRLGVDVYYEVVDRPKPQDIILLNNNKSWRMADYLHFYCKNGFPEYQKLQKFMSDANLALSVAMYLVIGKKREELDKFKEGGFVFKESSTVDDLAMVQEAVVILRHIQGTTVTVFTQSTRFWKAILMLVQNPNYMHEKFISNLRKLSHKIIPKARVQDYCLVLMYVHNYRNTSRVDLLEGLEREEV